MAKGLENLPQEERLKGLSFFSTERVRFEGSLSTSTQWVKASKEPRGEDNRQQERFHLNLGHTMGPVGHRKNLPGDTVVLPSLEVLKMNLDGV